MSDSVLEAFEIQLADGPTPVYKGGEVIKGKIHIRLRKQITVFSVRLQIKGRAVYLNDPIKKADIEKVYFDQDMALLERPPGKPDPHHFTWIANFDYHLPFEMPLPKGCPTSFEGPHGYIRYFIKASVVEEDGNDLKEYFVKNAFSIVAPSDGVVVRGEGASTKDTVAFGKCCCKGKVTAELDIPRTGFYPGENVYGKLKLDNQKPKDLLNHIEVRLADRVTRIGADKASASPYRTLYYRKLEEQSPVKGAKLFEKDDLFLLTIPPVPPSTKGDFDSLTEEDNHLTPSKGLFESPSTATLRFRKTPFLKVEYALQVSLGNLILLEVPIQIGELKTSDEATILRPFVAGAQPIQEADESGKIAFNGPFSYTPMYPFSEKAQPPQTHTALPTPTVKVFAPTDERIDEDAPEAVTTVTETFTEVKSTPDGPVVTETTTTTTTAITTADEVPVIIEEVKKAVIDSQPNEEAAQELKEKLQAQLDAIPMMKHDSPVSSTESVTENSDGGKTTVNTETFTEDGITTVRTTTVTVHPDGSEETKVHEEKTSEPVFVTHTSTDPAEARDAVSALSSKLGQPEPQEGDVTETHTETFEEDGVTTIRTTIITKHADGSESTRIHEESHSAEERTTVE